MAEPSSASAPDRGSNRAARGQHRAGLGKNGAGNPGFGIGEGVSTRGGFTAWADTVLAGTGWTAATVREAARRTEDDRATAALADGFAAAARGVAVEQGGNVG